VNQKIPPSGEPVVSIVRVGMAEDKKFGDGYEAIFKKKGPARKPAEKSASKPAKAMKKGKKK
jgi:hypothetical protein